MSQLRKLKREKVKTLLSSSIANLKEAYELGYAEGKADGYNLGAEEQRTLDIESVKNLLNGLEELPGIGMVTANKIRFLVQSKLNEKEDV